MITTENEIIKLLDESAIFRFGKNFKWRPGQREVTAEIIENILDRGSRYSVLNAPTGSGKSIIAICAADVLVSYGLRGYIITSDIMLQKQYMNDFKVNNLSWGSVMGQDNYLCNVNGEKFTLGSCKLKNLSYKQCESLECYSTCGYFQARNEAMNSPVSLLNYSYWLTQRNFVAPRMANIGAVEPFPVRDFCFFDEAHKISDVVQSQYSPSVPLDLYRTIGDVNTFIQTHSDTDIVAPATIRRIIEEITKTEDENTIFEFLKKLNGYLTDFIKTTEELYKLVKSKYSKKDIPENWKKVLSKIEKITDLNQKLFDFTKIIAEFGTKALVKCEEENNLVFKTLEVGLLVNKFMYQQSGYKVFMSATFGKMEKFAKISGMPDTFYPMDMSTNFDFSKSPIFLCHLPKLTFDKKETNTPKCIKAMDKILEEHPNERGIIHSGSYWFSENIKDNSKYSKRIITYKGSKERDAAIIEFLESKNKILVGPSLIEGLDLKDDKSRFQLFFKAPYPSLGDKFTKKKMQTDPDWYTWKTIISVLQGLGRSIRSADDWAVSYLIDGCFGDLINKSRAHIPDDIILRLKPLTEKDLYNNEQ